MVSISREPSVVTERRLVGVLQKSVVVHHRGLWSFLRCVGPIPDDALAAVRDVDGWCALVRSNRDDRELFCLTSIVFPIGVDNSGFVGWLASTIKRELGGGVFIVCGDNPRRGGIFDYWGYPAEIADEVRALVDRLCGPEARSMNLDLRVFGVAATSPASSISKETTFEFRERGGRVEASYSGGLVVSGHFLGRRNHDGTLELAYAQQHADGQLKTGISTMRVEQLGGSRLRLIEQFTWSDGESGRNVLESVE